MRGRKIEEIEGSSRGIYIRNTADITPKWKNMCSIADIPELYASVRNGSTTKKMNSDLKAIKEKNEIERIITIDSILFFDMDGTLIDTDYANFLSYKKAVHTVTNNGLELIYNPLSRFNRSFLKIALPDLTQADYEIIIQKKEEYYKDFLSETILNQEIASVLLKYSSTNKTVLVTNCRKDRALMTLNHFGLTDKFDEIFYRQISNNNERINKFKNAIMKLGVPPKLIVVFESEEIEIAFAKEAGIEIINPIIV